MLTSGIVGLGVLVAGVVFADVGTSRGDPVRAAAEYLWFPEDGLMYAMERSATAAERALIDEAQDVEQAKEALGDLPAVRIGSTFDVNGPAMQFSRVRVTLRGNRDDTVVIEGISAETVRCGPPLDGTLFYAPPQGEEQVVDLAFDLDSADRIARQPLEDGQPSETPYIEPQAVRGSGGRPFETTAFSESPYALTYVGTFNERPSLRAHYHGTLTRSELTLATSTRFGEVG